MTKVEEVLAEHRLVLEEDPTLLDGVLHDLLKTMYVRLQELNDIHTLSKLESIADKYVGETG